MFELVSSDIPFGGLLLLFEWWKEKENAMVIKLGSKRIIFVLPGEKVTNTLKNLFFNLENPALKI